MKSGIYKISNLVNGKCYVGSSNDVKMRWRYHKSTLRRGIHHSIALQRAWNLHGADNFEFVLLEAAEVENLRAREQHWIDTLRTYGGGYNSAGIAGAAMTGRKHTPEALAKLVIAGRAAMTPEECARRSAMFKGVPRSEDFKQKLSAARKGKPSPLRGVKRSPETIAKVKASLLRTFAARKASQA